MDRGHDHMLIKNRNDQRNFESLLRGDQNSIRLLGQRFIKPRCNERVARAILTQIWGEHANGSQTVY